MNTSRFLKSPLLFALLFASFSANSVTETVLVGAKNIDILNLSNNSGNITLNKLDNIDIDKKIKIFMDKVKFSKECKLNIKQDNNILSIENKAIKKGSPCEVNFVFSLPNLESLNIKNGNGDIKNLVDTKYLTVDVGKGDLSIKAKIEEITARIGFGNVNFFGKSTKANYDIGKGKVDAEYINIQDTSSIDVRLGYGSAHITLPENAKPHVNFNSAMGSLYNDFKSYKDSNNFFITMKTGYGSLDIISQKYKKNKDKTNN